MASTMNLWLVITACFYLTHGAAILPSFGPCTKLVVFGDSLSDNGVDPANDLHGFRAFSNGKVWSGYLAEFFSWNESNMAYSGAKSGLDNFYFPNWSGILWQVQQYITNVFSRVPPDALIALQAGGLNDLLSGVNDINAIFNNTQSAVSSLQAAGARRILLLNLPDVTLAPILSNPSSPAAALAPAVGGAIQLLNAQIAATYNNSEGVIVVDLYGPTKQIIQSFPNYTGWFDHHNGALPGQIFDYAWFDDTHLSTSAHRLVAVHLYNLLKSNIAYGF